ncbi:PREDICTED: UPF0764 protein C16orf89-like [Elephantulus edwardii]|uniref:UPF0764 protein C16orf89-like n=1 Tax=Elephantulus edwardii TaxID=28737 RepID=UPI0003F0BF27|nr:PREDICTED: UPF0764 protein C16orf89-like [Elephantulus edwardii]
MLGHLREEETVTDRRHSSTTCLLPPCCISQEKQGIMSTLGLLLPLLLLLALSPLQTSSLPKPHTLQDKITIANEILSSLDRAMVFLEEKPWYFTTTSMMALRILHVELKGVYYTWVQITQLRPVARRAEYLSKKLVILLQRATDILKVTAPDHLQVFQPAFKMGFWKLIGAWIQTNASLVYNMSQSPIVMENDPTNQCLKELLGTRSNISKPCSYSQFCRNLVTLPVYSGNYMNHQLLYFLISRMIGCTEGMFEKTEDYMNLFCSNLMGINAKIETGKYQYSFRDTFLENTHPSLRTVSTSRIHTTVSFVTQLQQS